MSMIKSPRNPKTLISKLIHRKSDKRTKENLDVNDDSSKEISSTDSSNTDSSFLTDSSITQTKPKQVENRKNLILVPPLDLKGNRFGDKTETESHSSDSKSGISRFKRTLSLKSYTDQSSTLSSVLPRIPISPRSGGDKTESHYEPKSPRFKEEHSPRASRETVTTSKFIKHFNIEGEKPIDSFQCTLILKGSMLAQGTMFITQNYVCFYSKMLHRKVKLSIPFKDVTCIRKCNVLVYIPNSIEIRTTTKKYYWTSLMLKRNEAFELLLTRWRLTRKKLGLPVVDYLEDIEAKEDDDFDWELEEDTKKREQFFSESCVHEFTKMNNTPSRYTELFPISVSEFFHRFLSNISVPFWMDFIAKEGKPMTSCTAWVKSPEGCCCERIMRFKQPIKNSLGVVGTTRVIQTQRYRFLNSSEIIFETSSYSKDVPYGNQFTVESRWHVKEYNGSESCELNISIGVRFVKRCLFRNVIEQTAIAGSREWFKNWIHEAMGVTVQHELAKKEIEPSPIVIAEEDEEGEQEEKEVTTFQMMVLCYYIYLQKHFKLAALGFTAFFSAILFAFIIYHLIFVYMLS